MATMRTSVGPVLAVCLGLSALASAQTMYRWTDKAGETHYTDDRSTIPKGAKVETTAGEELSELTTDHASQPAAPAQPAPAAQPSGPSNAELYWRQEFGRVRENIRRLEDEIAVDTKKVEDPNGLPINHLQCGFINNGFVGAGAVPVAGRSGCYYLPNPEWQRTKDRIETNKRALDRAKAEMHELDRRAANDAVPLEWRR